MFCYSPSRFPVVTPCVSFQNCYEMDRYLKDEPRAKVGGRKLGGCELEFPWQS